MPGQKCYRIRVHEAMLANMGKIDNTGSSVIFVIVDSQSNKHTPCHRKVDIFRVIIFSHVYAYRALRVHRSVGVLASVQFCTKRTCGCCPGESYNKRKNMDIKLPCTDKMNTRDSSKSYHIISISIILWNWNLYCFSILWTTGCWTSNVFGLVTTECWQICVK